MGLARTILAAALLATSAACGGDNDDDDRPGSPTGPTPTGRAAMTIENFVATATPAGAVVNYTVALTLPETAGVGATLSGVTLTVTTTTGSTLSRDYTATEAFGTNRIAANSTPAVDERRVHRAAGQRFVACGTRDVHRRQRECGQRAGDDADTNAVSSMFRVPGS